MPRPAQVCSAMLFRIQNTAWNATYIELCGGDIARMAIDRGRTAVINNFGNMWLSPLVGRLSDSVGRKRLMMLGRTGWVVFFATLAHHRTLWSRMLAECLAWGVVGAGNWTVHPSPRPPSRTHTHPASPPPRPPTPAFSAAHARPQPLPAHTPSALARPTQVFAASRADLFGDRPDLMARIELTDQVLRRARPCCAGPTGCTAAPAGGRWWPRRSHAAPALTAAAHARGADVREHRGVLRALHRGRHLGPLRPQGGPRWYGGGG
jgi:hypothetical protein